MKKMKKSSLQWGIMQCKELLHPVLLSSNHGNHGWRHIAFEEAHLIGAIRAFGANQANFIVYPEILGFDPKRVKCTSFKQVF